jgi:hypothetical protein
MDASNEVEANENELNGLHGVISQEMLFITIAVKTSNPTENENVLRFLFPSLFLRACSI